MAFTERECDAMDHARDQHKERALFPEVDAIETEPEAPVAIVHRCDIGTYSNGVYTDCAYEAGHVGRCSKEDSMSYPNPKIQALIDGHISIDHNWSERDFADLARAAADQAGVSVGDQATIGAILDDTLEMPRKLRRAR